MKQEDAREIVLNKALALKGNNYLFELTTGFGKTKIAIEKVKSLGLLNVLIVVPRNVLKKNWELELNKWWPNNNLNITYTTYVSFPKHKGNWDIVIYDEAHHLSERCREAICDFNIKYNILLSATINRNLKDELREVFDNLQIIKVKLRDAIEEGVLPDPKVYLIPLTLKSKFPTECIIKNPKAKGNVIEASWSERWQYTKVKDSPVKIYCTESQYISDLNSQIDWFKNKAIRSRNIGIKTKWLRLCSDRLKYLSNKKNPIIKSILEHLNNNRTLTFCGSIEQTEVLGKCCINSKNKESQEILDMFNSGNINHITTCNMLNEGMNIVNCQVGIYANLNSSETIVRQRCGRLLRHKNPIIIIPYYKNTREEELVNKMLENYNPKLITSIKSIEEIKI